MTRIGEPQKETTYVPKVMPAPLRKVPRSDPFRIPEKTPEVVPEKEREPVPV